MNREILLSRLEHCMLVMGKGMHEEQLGYSKCSPAQNHVLMVIGMQGDTGIKQLAEILRVTSGAATQHVDALEKAGLFERKTNISDRREVIVKITEKGKNVYQEMRSTKARILNEVFGELSNDELRTLVELIEKVSRKYIRNKEEAHGAV